jgi:hypothetical protein
MNGIPAPPNTQAAAPPEQPKPPKKPRVAARARNVAPSKARSGHKATPAKKATKRDTLAKSPRRKAPCAQRGKTAQIPGLLKRSGAATLKGDLSVCRGRQCRKVASDITD